MDKYKIKYALEIANSFHAGQYRFINGVYIPYVLHPIEVFCKLKTYGESDVDVLSAALLHDVIEDADNRVVAELEIKDLSEKVYSIVEELTLPVECSSKFKDEINRTKKYEHIAKIFISGSKAAQKIKLADRICNISDFINKPDIEYAKKYTHQFMDATTTYINASSLKSESDPICSSLITEYLKLVDFLNMFQ